MGRRRSQYTPTSCGVAHPRTLREESQEVRVSGSLSRILFPLKFIRMPLSFILELCYQSPLAAYPPTTNEQFDNVGLHGIAPHRVYLVSLQHYLYILSAALVLISIFIETDGR